jgi:DNA uptake protein ComE-like DNA-binding protein
MHQSQPFYADNSAARLGGNHGYRIDGDVACLNAELALAGDLDHLAERWALQLWACDAPYGGGALSGVKVAEAPLDLASGNSTQPQQLYAETFARLPAGGREYSMVLVLASERSDAFQTVHDFANYPARAHFAVPHFVGDVAADMREDEVSLHVDAIRNPRDVDNLSGSLALELWALREPYAGGQFAGVALAGVEFGRLAGQQSFNGLTRELSLGALPTGRFYPVWMLREWTAGGYVTRDYRNLGSIENALVPQFPEITLPAVIEAPVVQEPVAALEIAAAQPLAAIRSALVQPPSAVVEVVVVQPPSAAVEVVVVQPPSAAAAAPPSAATAQTTVAESANVESESASSCALVSIRHASLEELSVVPGLNRKLAAAIIKARPYRTFEDLLRVRGIGDKTLRRLHLVLTLE